MPIESRNPATGELLEEFKPHSDSELAAILEAASDRFRSWRSTRVEERTALIGALADNLDMRRDELAKMATEEMGKTLASARAEVEKCASACRHYAEHAREYLAPEHFVTGHDTSMVMLQPLGIILAIMPWNFPFWQVIRCAAPAVAAGNVVLLKHASNVPRCALALESAFMSAGFPKDVFRALLLDADRAQALVENGRIAAVSLTGSEKAGAAVGAAAGRSIKKVVLELGGSDPFIVMPSADFAKAVETGVRARIQNNGQSCIAAKRFIIHADIYEEFLGAFADRLRSLSVGNPMDQDTDLGPLALPSVKNALAQQVKQTVDAGATLYFEGKAEGGTGNWFPPVMLTDIPKETPARCEELFGPVASLFPAQSPDEAIALANESAFGLGASVWTNDEREKESFMQELEAGMVFLNAMVASDPRLPFGGVKRSGYGRELNRFGIHEFVNVKTVVAA